MVSKVQLLSQLTNATVLLHICVTKQDFKLSTAGPSKGKDTQSPHYMGSPGVYF